MAPWYDYRCEVCGNKMIDIMLEVADALTERYFECPICTPQTGQQTMHKKIIFPNPTRFKGPGWTTPTHGNKR